MLLICSVCVVVTFRVSVAAQHLLNSLCSKRETGFFSSKVPGLTGDKIQRTREGKEGEIRRMLKVKRECEGSSGQVWSLGHV